VFSAYGLAVSDIVLTAERSQPATMPADTESFNAVFVGLEEELQGRLDEQGLTFASVAYEREADIRFTMQLAEVATPVPGGVLSGEDIAQVGKEFERIYDSLYGEGSGFPDAGVQIITYRVRAIGTMPIQPKLPEHPVVGGEPESSGTRDVFLDVRRGREPATIYDYQALGADHVIRGPAVIEAPTTTVAVPPGVTARVDRLGNLVMTTSKERA